MRSSASAFLFAMALAVAACAESHQMTPRDQLLKRAAFDFGCTRDELSVTKIDDETRGVEGCGHKATYVRSCSHTGPNAMFTTDCTWVMNSAGSRRGD